MKIKTKLGVFQFFIIIFSILLFAAAYYALSSQNQLFRKFIFNQNTTTVNSIMDLQKKSILKTVEDYSIWDGMYNFVWKHDRKWANGNIDSILTDFEYNHVWILNKKGDVIYYVNDVSSRPEKDISVLESGIVNKLNDKSTAYFFLLHNNELFEIAVSKICPTEDFSRNRYAGYLVLGRIWSRTYLESLSRLTLHDVEIPGVVTSKNSGEITPDSNITIERGLPDIYGNNLLAVYFKRQVKEMDSLMYLSYGINFSILIVSILIFIVFFILTGKWIAHPLDVISETLHTENITLLEKLENRQDEFSEIIELIKNSIQDKHRIQNLLDDADSDLSMAVKVQKSFLLQEPPVDSEWDVAFYTQPMSDVSGDFYDFYVLDDRLSGLGIFDVSGHGIASGLVTMIAKTLFFRSFRDHADSSIENIFKSVSDELFMAIGTSDYYLTGILLRFNGDMVEYSNAMHPPLLKKNGFTSSRLYNEDGSDLSGFLIGFENDKYEYDQISIKIHPGEYLVLYTDCLLEAQRNTNERYSIDWIEHSLALAPCGTSRDVLDYLLKDFFESIPDKNKIPDDLTVIVLKKK